MECTENDIKDVGKNRNSMTLSWNLRDYKVIYPFKPDFTKATASILAKAAKDLFMNEK